MILSLTATRGTWVSLSDGMNARDKILLALARYKYLTRSQMIEQLHICKRDHLGEVLRGMLPPNAKEDGKPDNDKTIKQTRLTYEVIRHKTRGYNGKGRSEDMYSLSKLGADQVRHLVRNPLHHANPKIKPMGQDFHHRCGTVSAAIGLDRGLRSIGAQVDMSFYYNRYPYARWNTTIVCEDERENITPDMILEMTPVDGIRRMCCVEYYRGTHYETHAERLGKYSKALFDGTIRHALNIDNAVRVLVICETPAVLDQITKRLNAAIDPRYDAVRKLLFFRLPFGDFRAFRDGWFDLLKAPAAPFHTIPTV